MCESQVFPKCLVGRLKLLRLPTNWVQRKVKAFTNLSCCSILSVFRNLWYAMYATLAKLSLGSSCHKLPNLFQSIPLHILRTLENHVQCVYLLPLSTVCRFPISIASTCNFFPDLCLPQLSLTVFLPSDPSFPVFHHQPPQFKDPLLIPLLQ